MFQVFAWILIGVVGLATAVFALFFGGLPGLVVFALVLVIGGGLWWWQAGELEKREDGGRRMRPGDR
ncbi:MAG: hypothetical protein Q8P18_28860 [Pseudomonadota bacterium]|nr:hypothetical protein [Pseudomonadota bacterium]